MSAIIWSISNKLRCVAAQYYVGLFAFITLALVLSTITANLAERSFHRMPPPIIIRRVGLEYSTELPNPDYVHSQYLEVMFPRSSHNKFLSEAFGYCFCCSLNEAWWRIYASVNYPITGSGNFRHRAIIWLIAALL